MNVLCVVSAVSRCCLLHSFTTVVHSQQCGNCTATDEY